VGETFKFDELFNYLNERWPEVKKIEEPARVIIRPHETLGTIFFFEGGTVVCWGAAKNTMNQMLKVGYNNVIILEILLHYCSIRSSSTIVQQNLQYNPEPL
jgi:hypothetical protein